LKDLVTYHGELENGDTCVIALVDLSTFKCFSLRYYRRSDFYVFATDVFRRISWNRPSISFCFSKRIVNYNSMTFLDDIPPVLAYSSKYIGGKHVKVATSIITQ